MARIAGVNIPIQKHTWVGLTHIYGIGKSRALQICEATGVAPETKIRDLTDAEIEIKAKVVVNATGAWCDTVRRMDDPEARAMIHRLAAVILHEILFRDIGHVVGCLVLCQQVIERLVL